MRRTAILQVAIMFWLLVFAAKADTLFDSGEPELGLNYSINWSQAWGLAGALTVPSSGWRITNLSTKLASASSTVSMGVVIRIYADRFEGGKHYPGTVLSSTPVTVSGTAGAWYSTGALDVTLPPGYAWFGIEHTGGASGVTGFYCPTAFELEAGVMLYNPPDYPNHIWGSGRVPQLKTTFRVYGDVPAPAPTPPDFQSIALSGTNVTLTWAAVPGATSYDILEADSLTSLSWDPKTNITSGTTWTGSRDKDARFYRIRAIRP